MRFHLVEYLDRANEIPARTRVVDEIADYVSGGINGNSKYFAGAARRVYGNCVTLNFKLTAPIGPYPYVEPLTLEQQKLAQSRYIAEFVSHCHNE